jgi:hypothetical protein
VATGSDVLATLFESEAADVGDSDDSAQAAAIAMIDKLRAISSFLEIN